MVELHKNTASEIEEMIKNKKITSTEVVEYFLKRIESIDGKIGAIATVTTERARRTSTTADTEGTDGLELAGVPIIIKDNIVSHGDITSSASKILRNYKGTYDATVVRKLEENMIPILGKANMDEFAMGSSNENSSIKNVSNPWDLDKIPGGSSGGSAAAVAAMEIPISLGSDTGGSIRQPASLSGIYGIKPTYGRVSRYGLMSFGSSLDQIGAMARSTKDLAKVMKVISGSDEKDPTTAEVEVPDYVKLLAKDIKGLKVGLPKEYFTEELNDDVRKIVQETIETLEKLGAEVKEVSLPYTKYAISTYYIISSAEAASNLSKYDGVRYGIREDNSSVEEMYVQSRTKGFGAEVKRRIMIGNYVLSSGFYDAYYKKASQVRRLIREDFERVFKDVDILLTPTSPTTAFKKGEKVSDPMQMYLADIYTVSVSMAGLPAMSLPAGFIDGLPVGVQLIGNYFREDLLFNVSHMYEINKEKIEYPEV